MIWLLLILLLLLLSGVPLFVIIGGITLTCFIVFPVEGFELPAFLSEGFLDAVDKNVPIMEKVIALSDEPTLIAIPFFMVAGTIMSQGAIARRLVDFASALFGWLPGGLAVSAVFACMFFAAISGSSPVTVITIGSIMLPALMAQGYDENFSLGLVTSAGSLGIIIPPSIPMIVYAIFAAQSEGGAVVKVEELFIAGIGPGILLGACLAGYCVMTGRGVATIPFSWSRLKETFVNGIWALFLPVFILGGIYLGVFNATQAAAMSVILALVIEIAIHKELEIGELPELMRETAVLMGSILVIIALAMAFSLFLTEKGIPDLLAEELASRDMGPIQFALALNVMLLLVGCLMDIISAIILFVPLVAPLAMKLGFDPLHLGLIFIVNLEIGYLTPPLGLNLFVSAGYFGKPFGQVIKSVLPFMGMMLVALMIITYVPRVTLQFVALKRGDEQVTYMDFPDGTPRVGQQGLRGEQSVQDMMDSVDVDQIDPDKEPEYDRYGYGLGGDEPEPEEEEKMMDSVDINEIDPDKELLYDEYGYGLDGDESEPEEEDGLTQEERDAMKMLNGDLGLEDEEDDGLTQEERDAMKAFEDSMGGEEEEEDGLTPEERDAMKALEESMGGEGEDDEEELPEDLLPE